MELHLEDKNCLYNKFEPAKTRLSADVYNYIKTCFEEVPLKERRSAVISVSSNEPVDTAEIKALLDTAVDRELVSMDKKLRINRVKMWRLYIIGVALIILGVMLTVFLNQIALEVISIVGSMAVKDAATIQIENNPDIKLNKRLLEQLKRVPVNESIV